MKNFEKNKISIIMGVYNCEESLKDSVESIINQTYSNWEFIICDDGSKDNSWGIIKDYKEKYPQKFKIFLNEQNKGLNYTLNRCAKHVTGEYIARQDADDTSVLTRFEEQIELFKLNDYDVISTGINIVDNGNVIGIKSNEKIIEKKDFVKGSPIAHPTVIVKSKVFFDVGGYEEHEKLLRVEDYHLWFKIFSKNYKIFQSGKLLYNYTDDMSSLKKRTWKNRWNEVYVKKYGFKLLNIPKRYYIYIYRTILVGLLPSKIYMKLHRKRG